MQHGQGVRIEIGLRRDVGKLARHQRPAGRSLQRRTVVAAVCDRLIELGKHPLDGHIDVCGECPPAVGLVDEGLANIEDDGADPAQSPQNRCSLNGSPYM